MNSSVSSVQSATLTEPLVTALAVSGRSRTSMTMPFTLCFPSAIAQAYFRLRRHKTSFSIENAIRVIIGYTDVPLSKGIP